MSSFEPTPLFLAAASGDLEGILEHAPSADSGDLNRSLAQAAAFSQFEAADALCEAGADPDGDYDPCLGTVLFPACEFINPEGIRYLLDHGADPSREVIRIDGPRNALDHLLRTHHRSPLKPQCVSMLLQAGVPHSDTPELAVHLGSLSRLRERLREHPEKLREPLETDAGQVPLQGASLLHLAVEFNFPELAEFLIEEGLEPDQRAEKIPGSANTEPVWPTDLVALGGQTPLFHAKGYSKPMLQFLLDRGADPSHKAPFLRDGEEIQLTPLEFFQEIDRIECNLLEEILTLSALNR